MIVAQFRQLCPSQVYFNKEEYEMNEMLFEGSYQSYQSVGIYHLNDVFHTSVNGTGFEVLFSDGMRIWLAFLISSSVYYRKEALIMS